MSVYGYCRVSTMNQAVDGESLDVQQRQIEGWCHMQGLTLDQTFVEKGVSGSKPISDRPEGKALWSALKAGDTIIASKLDRMFRSALDALKMVEELKAKGVSLVLLDLGGDISGNGLSKVFVTIAAAFAEAERDRIRERITQAKADQKARGRYLGGKVPFGYKPDANGDLQPVPEQQAVITTIKAMADKPLRTIQSTIEAEHGCKLSLVTIGKLRGITEAS